MSTPCKEALSIRSNAHSASTQIAVGVRKIALAASFSTVMSLIMMSSAAAEWDVRGNVTGEFTLFPHTPIHSANQASNFSLSTEMEFYSEVGNAGSLTITPFARIDRHDSERTHVDFREFLYTHVGDTWEARVGLGKVFFGVAESLNLVDIINQTDAVENLSTDQKLGQPMVNLLLIRDWGSIDLYLLPGFRERTFAGVNGRPRLPVPIDADSARYESGDGNDHIDLAARVSTVAGDWDLAAHVFHGTARDPELQFDPTLGALVPFYAQTTQIGLDAQATLESWLLKTELVHRQGDTFDNHTALVTGFEYSFYDIQGSGADIGIVAEYLMDDRGEDGPALLQNDALIGLRFALNDSNSTDALLGVIHDFDGKGSILSLEANRRFGSSVKGTLSYTGWSVSEADSALIAFDREDNVRLELGYFF